MLSNRKELNKARHNTELLMLINVGNRDQRQITQTFRGDKKLKREKNRCEHAHTRLFSSLRFLCIGKKDERWNRRSSVSSVKVLAWHLPPLSVTVGSDTVCKNLASSQSRGSPPPEQKRGSLGRTRGSQSGSGLLFFFFLSHLLFALFPRFRGEQWHQCCVCALNMKPPASCCLNTICKLA